MQKDAFPRRLTALILALILAYPQGVFLDADSPAQSSPDFTYQALSGRAHWQLHVLDPIPAAMSHSRWWLTRHLDNPQSGAPTSSAPNGSEGVKAVFNRIQSLTPLELQTLNATPNARPVGWPAAVRSTELITTELSLLILMPDLVASWLQSAPQPIRDSMTWVYAAAYFRQLPPDQQHALEVEAGTRNLTAWMEKISHLSSVSRDRLQLEVGTKLSGQRRKVLEQIIEHRDAMMARARGLRVASEILQTQGKSDGLPLLVQLTQQESLFNVIAGLQPASLIGGTLTAGEATLLRDLLWGLRQVQGTNLQLVELPDGIWCLYDLQWLQHEAKQHEGKDRSLVHAATIQGIEHLIKKDHVAKKGLFHRLLQKPKTSKGLAEVEPALRSALRSVLDQPRTKRFSQWDSRRQMYRAATENALWNRVMSLLPPPVDGSFIATIDRPRALADGLEAEAENYRIFNRVVRRITVVDDSRPEYLRDNEETLRRISKAYGMAFTHFSSRDRRAQQSYYAYRLAETYEQQWRAGTLDHRIQSLLIDRQILVDGQLDAARLHAHLQKTVFDHISGVRNFTLLNALGLRFMHFDDDAPPETYTPSATRLQKIRSARRRLRTARLDEYRKKVGKVLGRPLPTDIELYSALKNPPRHLRTALADVERIYFGYAPDDAEVGQVPRAMGEILSKRSLEIDKLGHTHQRYDALMDAPEEGVVIGDFEYSRPRREKKSGAFTVLPVDVVGGAEALGQTVGQRRVPVMRNDLRGTMGIPVNGTEAADIWRRKIVYVPYAFSLDQDTSGLVQFYRYLTMAQKAIQNLQHADQTALVVEGVSAAAGLMFVIFNRAAIFNSYPLPTIGRDLRFEEPPYLQWVVEPLSGRTVAMAFSPVAGGQQRSIGERLYRISFQDLTEVIGVLAAHFYRKAVQAYFDLDGQNDRGEATRRLGAQFVETGRQTEMTADQKASVLAERQRRVHLLSVLSYELAAEEGPVAADLMTVLIQYAHDFHLYRARNLEAKDYSPADEHSDYFYQVSIRGGVLEWKGVIPGTVEKGEWLALPGKRGQLSLPAYIPGQPETIELEPGRSVHIRLEPSRGTVVLAPIPNDKEPQFLEEIRRRIRGQLQADGGTLLVWPELVQVAANLQEGLHRTDRSVPALRMALESADPNERLASISALGDIDTHQARSALHEAAALTDDPRLQSFARLTLSRWESLETLMLPLFKALAAEWKMPEPTYVAESPNEARFSFQLPDTLAATEIDRFLVLLLRSVQERDGVLLLDFHFPTKPKISGRVIKREAVAIKPHERLYRTVEDALDRQRRATGLTRDGATISSFFQIWETGMTVENLVLYKDGTTRIFQGGLPASVVDDPDVIRVVLQNAGRAKRPNRAGAQTARIRDDQPSFLWPEIVPEDASQLRIRWQGQSGLPWNIMFNPFSFWPPHREVHVDDAIQMVIARADRHVSQKAMSDLETLTSLAEIYRDLRLSQGRARSTIRIAVNGWYGSEQPLAPKAGATQPHAHAQGMNRRFPIENQLFENRGLIQGVPVSLLSSSLNEGTAIRLDTSITTPQAALELTHRILKDIERRGHSYNLLFAPGENTQHLRIFIVDRPVGTPVNQFSNEWAYMETNGFILVDDPSRFYDLSEGERQALESGEVANIPDWLQTLKSSRAQDGKFLRIHPTLLDDIRAARRIVTASHDEMEKLLHQLKGESSDPSFPQAPKGQSTQPDSTASTLSTPNGFSVIRSLLRWFPIILRAISFSTPRTSPRIARAA